ncbi:hypothetical protein ILUMI_18488 [Ignelater luminosus]|uniref:Uncharacterized protein n=1 Tax=Ignelater luminosus TaxID=2038154 RepID=A0A8K0G0U6_IGNLU|nr:hypothetical protein ILUMI_18488 [Ignelater luminosus]
MKYHISEMLVVTDRLSLDEALTENLILALLLEILPESCDKLVTVLESRPESELTKELAKEKLSHERKGSYAIHFVLKDFYLCKEYFHSKVQFYVHPRDYNPGLQLADVNFSTPLPLGTNVLTKVQAVADMQMIGRDIWIPLFTVEDDLCRILYMYLGQLMYDLQRDFGILPKSCPVPRLDSQGNYLIPPEVDNLTDKDEGLDDDIAVPDILDVPGTVEVLEQDDISDDEVLVVKKEKENQPNYKRTGKEVRPSVVLYKMGKKKGYWATDTLRNNRISNPPLLSPKEIGKGNRGSHDYVFYGENEVLLVRWNDKCVTMATNYDTIKPMVSVQSWNKNEKAKTPIPASSDQQIDLWVVLINMTGFLKSTIYP